MKKINGDLSSFIGWIIIISNHVKVLYGFYWWTSMIFYHHLRVFLWMNIHYLHAIHASWRRWCASALPCPTAQRSPVWRWSSPSGPLTGQRLDGVHHFGLSERSFPKIPHPIPIPKLVHLLFPHVPSDPIWGTNGYPLWKPHETSISGAFDHRLCLWSVLYDLRLYVSEKPHHIQKSLWKTQTTFLFPWQFHRFFLGSTKPRSHKTASWGSGSSRWELAMWPNGDPLFFQFETLHSNGYVFFCSTAISHWEKNVF